MYKLIIIGNACDIPYVVDNLKTSCEVIETISFDNDTYVNISLSQDTVSIADYIIIACDSEASEDIFNKLVSIEQIKDKVLDFYRIAHASLPRMTADRIMMNQSVSHYETVALGLSHAEVGIIPDKMTSPVANLAVGGQDIFYNYEVLKYCITEHPEKLTDLKNVIFDMFDYTYFNYDTSLSRNAITYFVKSGGILLAHHFDSNKNMTIDFKSVLNSIDSYHYRRVTENQVLIWDKIIVPDIFGAPLYKGYTTMPFLANRTGKYIPNEDNTLSFLNTSLIHKKHPKTLKENETLFLSMLKYIYALNPEMRIHLVLFPQHISSCKDDDTMMEQWKEYFYNKIAEYKSLFDNISFHDFKYCDISCDSDLFADIDHLNYEGAILFTQMLNRLI
ncbi:MAG: hypothetical protein K6E49_00365 [Lachnospiraceae bacterium]|nr:hypothetical protein [Lachnospiraceae bacterium]